MFDDDVSAAQRQPGSNAALLAEATRGWRDNSERAQRRREQAREWKRKNRYRNLQEDPWSSEELFEEIEFQLDGRRCRLPLAEAEALASRLGFKRDYLITRLKEMGRPDLALVFTQEKPVGGDVWLYGERTARRERQRDAARRKRARASQGRAQ